MVLPREQNGEFVPAETMGAVLAACQRAVGVTIVRRFAFNTETDTFCGSKEEDRMECLGLLTGGI